MIRFGLALFVFVFSFGFAHEDEIYMTPDQQENQFREYAENIRTMKTALENSIEIVLNSKGNSIMLPIVWTTALSTGTILHELENIANAVKIQEDMISQIPVSKFVSMTPQEKLLAYNERGLEVSLSEKQE